MARKTKAFDRSKYQNWIDPHTCRPYEKNAKKHDEKQIKNIVNSINRFGWQQDTVLTSDGVLVIGHGRRLAAIQLGCMMPYHVIDKTADELTDEDIRELRIADNQTNAETGYDLELLEADLEGLEFDGFDFDFGIDTVIEDSDEEIRANPVLVLPESRIMIFGISSFGTESECFIECKLSETEAARLQERLQEIEVAAAVARIKEALNAL